MTERSLYECFHARVTGSEIRCRYRHRFLPQSSGGGLPLRRLTEGEPLVFAVCQECPDFDRLGPPVPEEERGWVDLAGRLRKGGARKCGKTPSTERHSASTKRFGKRPRTG